MSLARARAWGEAEASPICPTIPKSHRWDRWVTASIWRSRPRARRRNLEENTMHKLTTDQGAAVARARRAMTYLAAAWPDDAAPLLATAAAGALVDLLLSAVGPRLVETINQQWQGTPFQITRRKAN